MAIATGAALWTHFASHPRPAPEPELEPAWQWNDEARIDVCLTKRGAHENNLGANLRLEGTLVGFGDVSPGSESMGSGNIVACREEPGRYIEIKDGERGEWRIMYALTGVPYPTLRARVGAHVRFRFDSNTHLRRFTSFLLLDETGPLLELVDGASYLLGAEEKKWDLAATGRGPEEKGDLPVTWGRPFGRRSNDCGGDEIARAMQISGDREVSVPPGQGRSVLLRGTRYTFWNLRSVDLVGRVCLDQDPWISWLLWRD